MLWQLWQETEISQQKLRRLYPQLRLSLLQHFSPHKKSNEKVLLRYKTTYKWSANIMDASCGFWHKLESQQKGTSFWLSRFSVLNVVTDKLENSKPR